MPGSEGTTAGAGRMVFSGVPEFQITFTIRIARPHCSPGTSSAAHVIAYPPCPSSHSRSSPSPTTTPCKHCMHCQWIAIAVSTCSLEEVTRGACCITENSSAWSRSSTVVTVDNVIAEKQFARMTLLMCNSSRRSDYLSHFPTWSLAVSAHLCLSDYGKRFQVAGRCIVFKCSTWENGEESGEGRLSESFRVCL